MKEKRSEPTLEALRERIHYLEETNQWMLESFEEVSIVDEERSFGRKGWDTTSVYNAAQKHLSRLVSFETIAFYKPDPVDNDFVLEYIDPPVDREGAGREVDALIDEGLFGWALHQNRAIPIPSRIDGRVFVLHGLETRRNVIGMFVGIVKGAEAIPNKLALNLMTMILFKTAVALEQLELYRRVSDNSKVLEQKVEERTKDLMAAKDTALKASRLKSEFVANMSHELRTPLNGILGMTELLLESELGDKERKFASIIHSSGDSLLSVISDILDFSKIEAGKLIIEHIPFDLTIVIDEVVAILERTADEKGLTIKSEYSLGGLKDFYGDPLRVRQVVMNLVGNAIKFTDTGSVTVSAHIEGLIGDQQVLKISVADTGIGIPENVQASLFQSFTQADGSTTRKYGGTGLGLAISKQLVVLMGGTIELNSSLGHGSTFSFTFPLNDGPQEQKTKASLMERNAPVHRNAIPSPRPTGAQPEAYGTPSIQILRILIAEDNLVNQEVCRGMFAKFEYQTTIVSDGGQALKEIERSPYDIIFMDCQMPGMDGYEATRQIRRSKCAGARAIIIAMTADVLQGSREKCIQAGMDDYIGKPFKQAELREVLTKWTGVLRGEPETSGNDRVESQAPPIFPEMIIDTERIKEINNIRSHSRPSILARVVRHFQDDVPRKIAAMREGVVLHDHQTLRRVAHALRGSSAQVGANIAAKLCERIELLATSESVEGADRLIEALDTSLTEALALLHTFVPKEELT